MVSSLCHKLNFITPISLQPDYLNLGFKGFKVWNKTLGFKDIEIRKSEFMVKTQLQTGRNHIMQPSSIISI